MSPGVVSLKHYVAIFIVALATITMQILVARIFSVTFYYHFAFAGITFAMLGLTAGAIFVYRHPDQYGAQQVNQVLAVHGARFAAGLVFAVLSHAWLPGLTYQWRNGIAVVDALPVAFMGGSFIALVYAFFQGGVCIAVLLTRFPAYAGRLYAVDLCGAAFGCIVVIAMLNLLDPIASLLAISCILAWMACAFLPSVPERTTRRGVTATALLLTLLLAVQFTTQAIGSPLVHLTWAKGRLLKERPLLFEAWNTYSRVTIYEHGTAPFGWGFGITPPDEIEQKFLTIDAEAGTVLTRFNGDLGKVRYLRDDIINLGYHVRDIDRVAVIGVGGGRDILSALVSGASHVQGIELNPAITHALAGPFGKFTGHLGKRPEVDIVTAEARTYLTMHRDTYDLIQISLIDTWAATAAGGLTLSENTLYTTDAWREFLERLTSQGMLAVSRWYSPQYSGEFYRMVAIAADSLKTLHPGIIPRQHILAAYVLPEQWAQLRGIVTVLVSKSPFTQHEVSQFTALCEHLGFVPLLTPTMAIDDVSAHLATGEADREFYAHLPIDVTPSTDDRPFFFHMARLAHVLAGLDPTTESVAIAYQNNQAVYTLLIMCLFTFAVVLATVVWPLTKLYVQNRGRFEGAGPLVVFFGGIGLGFMLIEIAQMQRLMIFLGHPVYGLSVVLFTLLLASGIGSYTQRNVGPESQYLWLRPVALCIVLAVIGVLTPPIMEHLKYYDTPVRILATGAITAAMGLVMGMMFPVGVALATRARHEELLPWYWGVNGAMSVFASVAAVVLSLEKGISFAFWSGIACYAMCVLAVLMQRR